MASKGDGSSIMMVRAESSDNIAIGISIGGAVRTKLEQILQTLSKIVNGNKKEARMHLRKFGDSVHAQPSQSILENLGIAEMPLETRPGQLTCRRSQPDFDINEASASIWFDPKNDSGPQIAESRGDDGVEIIWNWVIPSCVKPGIPSPEEKAQLAMYQVWGLLEDWNRFVYRCPVQVHQVSNGSAGGEASDIHLQRDAIGGRSAEVQVLPTSKEPPMGHEIQQCGWKVGSRIVSARGWLCGVVDRRDAVVGELYGPPKLGGVQLVWLAELCCSAI
ncbi:hypothetical protein B0H13DRAFT_2281792 [Mycena leptocephala]|nr:hypothetical protein B0H13DRAFT_2281792 [Mycena leptocephala]